ncbi:MAG: porin [Sphingobium sp.]|nr:porin [Sphingobium sp.]
MGSTALWLAPAHANAQAATDSATTDADAVALKDEVARLRAELDMLKAEMRAMRGPQTAAPAPANTLGDTALAAAPPTSPTPAPAAKAAPDPVQISWKGAPEFKGSNGWSFKPRGRFQIDAGYLSAPSNRASGQADGRGFTTRVRRAYIGMQGTMPGNLSYRAEVDLAGSSPTWTDLYLAYDRGPINITVGQHHPFTSLEQIQSDLFLSFNERASFIGAFNLERRVGISAGYNKGDIMINAGVFTDDIKALTNDGNKTVSYDGRVVWMPKLGDTQLHIAGSAHYRDLGTFQAMLGTQYRQRPYIGTTDIRYVDTGLLTVNSETHFGAELAVNHKRFHFVSEGAWLKADRPGTATDPSFFGGYAEFGIFLTNDSRGYKNGTFERTVPTNPLDKGGLGALEFNIRYDRLDLTSGTVGGGVQDAFGASFVWTPTAYVHFSAGYMHLIYNIPSAQPKFTADSLGLRAQVDF